MRKIDIIVIILCLFNSATFCAEKDQSSYLLNSISSKKISVEESVICIKENALFIVAIPTLLFFHKEILETMTERPYLSAICCYALINYLCDTILDHQHQQSLIDLIALIKKIALYLVISHGIKNHMHHKKQLHESDFDDQTFFNSITEKLPYTFNEVTLIVLKSYQELKSNLQQLNDSIQIESEEFVFLCHASSISLHTILYLTQNDPILYNMISLFEKNPESEFKSLLQYLTNEITINFLTLERKLLAFEMPSIQKHPLIP